MHQSCISTYHIIDILMSHNACQSLSILILWIVATLSVTSYKHFREVPFVKILGGHVGLVSNDYVIILFKLVIWVVVFIDIFVFFYALIKTPHTIRFLSCCKSCCRYWHLIFCKLHTLDSALLLISFLTDDWATIIINIMSLMFITSLSIFYLRTLSFVHFIVKQ